MKRSSFILALAAGCFVIPASQSLALPIAPTPDSASSLFHNVDGTGYCPPGWKVTRKGGCKPSDYIKRHPWAQQQYNQPRYGRPRYDGGNDYYNAPRRPRYYDSRPRYDDGGDDGDY